MLRDKNLVPLSHQHQHALALCVRIERDLEAGGEPARWHAEIERAWGDEIRYHFGAEEAVLFPAAQQYAEMAPLVEELLAEHVVLRGYMESAASLGPEELRRFSETLSAHVRKEERQLFEECQRLMPAEELGRLGRAMDEWFRSSGMPGASCGL